MRKSTKFFRSCLGVFQGGGCKGVALAGAYQAAVEAGVHLSEVAGASAGSILAALIGAGGDAEYVLEKVSGLNFVDFLSEPERNTKFSTKKLFASFVPNKLISEETKKIYFYNGIYSSANIETWIDARLSELLPGAKRPVRFKDLPIPTYIIATDLLSSNVQVWSNYSSPGDSVAFAVRSSCSMPLFFQPVAKGDNRFIDGGVLSNLPAFVFSKPFRPDNYRPLSNKILAFQLESEYTKPSEWSFRSLVYRLANTVVHGAAEIQKKILDNVYVIPIKTKGVKSTDFDKMNEEKVKQLIADGRDATNSFISNELLSLRKNSTISISFYDEEEIYSAFICLTEKLPQQIYISNEETKWSWKIFPTLLYLKIKGVKITVVVSSKSKGEADEESRRKLLTNMGIEVIELEELPIRGYYLKYSDHEHQDSTIVYSKSTAHYSPLATQYSGVEHSQATQAISHMYQQMLESSNPEQVDFEIELIPVKPNEIYQRLKRGVRQYSGGRIKFDLQDIDLSDILLIDQYTREFKYQQIMRLSAIFNEFGMEEFSPIGVKLLDGSVSIVTPPVFEISGSNYIAVEGNTRSTYYWFNNKKTIKGITVENVNDPLPSVPIRIQNVRIAGRKIPPHQSMNEFDYNQFRPIENAVHQPKE